MNPNLYRVKSLIGYSDVMADSGLRARKKQATRAHIADVATTAFARRGFDNVTVAEVAEAAGVSKMTVFNYFPRKEDLLLDRHEDRMVELQRVVTDRPPGVSLVAAMRRDQHELLAARHPLSGATEGAVGFWPVVRASPALVNRMHEQHRETDEALAAVLVAELGDTTWARLVADLLGATIRAVFATAAGRMLAGDDPDEVRAHQVHVIDDAFDLLENGLGDCGVR